MSPFDGKRLVIFGCGYVGSAVARAALERGTRVAALTRNAERAAELRAAGIEMVVSDLASEAWHAQIPGAPDFLLNCVSSGGGGIEAYRHSYVGGMTSIVAWAQRAGAAGTAVYTSSTSVYPQGNGAVVDESAPTAEAGDRAQLLVGAEEIFRGASAAWRRWFVLRLAGIYGPGRHYLTDQVRTGEVAGVGEHRLNLIHRDDAAAAILACFVAPTGQGSDIFNVADDGPARKSDVAAWLAARLSLPAPRFTAEPASPRQSFRDSGPVVAGLAEAGLPGAPAGTISYVPPGSATPATTGEHTTDGGQSTDRDAPVRSRRALTPDRVIGNGRLKARLGWRPQYPTFREGYASFLSR
jgi:nucleoside-diphosphate-sugar epimerase